MPGAPFYFSSYPSSAVRTDEAGRLETLHLTNASRPELHRVGLAYLRENQAQMPPDGEEIPVNHLLKQLPPAEGLLQDGGRFLMAWMQEAKRTVEFHVADCWTYMDVSGTWYLTRPWSTLTA